MTAYIYRFLKLTIVCIAVFQLKFTYGQTGPNSPLTAANNASTGVNAWVNSGNILSSNNVYAAISTRGNSNYLTATNFGFSISAPANIDGIVVEVEKREVSFANVAILNNWTVGLTKTVSAGINRCLFVLYFSENGGGVIRDVTAMTYGGQAMTQVTEQAIFIPAGFSGKIEIWSLGDAGITAAAGTAIIPTYAAGALSENVDVFTAICFQGVDQIAPVSDTRSSGLNGVTNPHQLATPLNTLAGGVAVSAVMCGNNTTPALVIGGTNTYTVNSGFTEGIDRYDANAGYSTSGLVLQTATKVIAASGTEQPTFTFLGTPNRHVIVAFNVQRARALDNEVRIIQSGTIGGNNLAQTTTAWPTTDTYSAYGGAANLWGLAWTTTLINATNFGVALSALMQNGNLNVDHMRITVYSTSTLPIELLQFTATPQGQQVATRWITATETNNDYFIVEKSNDGLGFEEVGRFPGAGYSMTPLTYTLDDQNPYNGLSYYRLKQVDFNGDFTYSDIVPVSFEMQSAWGVYPNPSVDGIYHFLQDGNTELRSVTVFNETLQLIKQVPFSDLTNPVVNITDLPDGIYFLLCNDGFKNKIVKVQKMSKISG